MKTPVYVVFQRREVTRSDYFGAPKKHVTFGVYLDLDELDGLALKASRNKSRKSKGGPVHVEVHTQEAAK